MGEKKRGAKEAEAGIGLRLSNFSTAMTVGMVILCICLFFTTVDVLQRYDRVMEATETYVHWSENAAKVHEASEYLTEQVRLFAQTAERDYMENYFMESYVTKRRTRVLDEIREYYADTQVAEELEQAIRESQKLMEREYYAMKLVCTGAGIAAQYIPPEVQEAAWQAGDDALSPQAQWDKGRALLYDAAYQEAKDSIYGHLDAFATQIVEEEGRQQQESISHFLGSVHTQRMFVGVVIVLELITLFILMQMIAKPLRQFIRRIRERAMLDIEGVEELQLLAGVYNEMYEAIAAESAEFRYQPENDPLTGVMHEGTYREIAQALEENDEPMALMIFRMDDFSALTAQYDSKTIDWMLKKAAALLNENAELKDHIFHIGREEFAAVFMDTTRAKRTRLEEIFRKINDKALESDEGLPPFSMSAGAAFSPEGWQKALSAKAREALLQAHQQGAGELSFYEE